MFPTSMTRNFARVSRVIQFQFLCLYNQRPIVGRKGLKQCLRSSQVSNANVSLKFHCLCNAICNAVSTIINILVGIKHRVRWQKPSYSYPDISCPERLIQLLSTPPTLAKNMTPSSCQIDCCQFQVTNTQKNLQLENNQQQNERRLAWKEIKICIA